MVRIWLLLILIAAFAPAQAVENFFAAPVPSGQLDVRLHPSEDVDLGVPTLVSFGLPFPRESVTESDLSTVRVLHNGVEVAAHVSQLTPWRHRSNALIDLKSVRVALVQFMHTFSNESPASETVVLQWGVTPRTLNIPAAVDPRSAWHQVTAGSFVGSDNVFEPNVYAVLPSHWLVRGVLKSSRSTPFDASNPEARDSPASNDAIAHWPEYQEGERAFKNNFYTEIWRDDPSVPTSLYPQYKTLREPWLYDRAATMFVLYFRSGSFMALREAVQAAQFYANHQNASGFFTIDGAAGDVKYAYNESLAYTYWITGDPQMLAKIGAVAGAADGFAHAWTPQRNFWTERHAAFKLLANVVAYEVLGNIAQRNAVDQILADLRAHQDGAGGQIPAPRIDGGLYHYGSQHDYDWAQDSLGGSSWMTALLSDAAVRAYATGEDAATAGFISRLGDFMRATVVDTTEHSYDTTDEALALPRYGMLIDGSDGQRNYEDVEHALDVAAQIAWGHYFRELGGGDGSPLRSTALDLYATYDEGVNFWIRPTAPPINTAFRVNPPRKWGWEHRTSDGLAFALIQIDPNAIFASGFESP